MRLGGWAASRVYVYVYARVMRVVCVAMRLGLWVRVVPNAIEGVIDIECLGRIPQQTMSARNTARYIGSAILETKIYIARVRVFHGIAAHQHGARYGFSGLELYSIVSCTCVRCPSCVYACALE